MPGEDSTPSSNRSELAWLKQATTRSALKRLGIRSSVLAGQLALALPPAAPSLLLRDGTASLRLLLPECEILL